MDSNQNVCCLTESLWLITLRNVAVVGCCVHSMTIYNLTNCTLRCIEELPHSMPNTIARFNAIRYFVIYCVTIQQSCTCLKLYLYISINKQVGLRCLHDIRHISFHIFLLKYVLHFVGDNRQKLLTTGFKPLD